MNTKFLFTAMTAFALMATACSSDSDPVEEIVDPVTEPTQTVGSLNDDIDALAESPTYKMMLVAHRAITYSGNQAGIPENSVAAIQQCIKEGIDMVEIDPRATKDGKIIIMHNKTIDEATNGKGTVADMTYSQIQRFSLYDANGKVTSHKVPTLEEALEAAKGKIYVCIDLKDLTCLNSVVYEVKKRGMSDQVCYYTSTDWTTMDDVLTIDQNAILMPWVSTTSEIPSIQSDYPMVKLLQFSYFYNTINTHAPAVKAAGLVGYANHIDVDDKLLGNDFSIVDGFATKPISLIQSNYCDLILPHIKEKGWRL